MARDKEVKSCQYLDLEHSGPRSIKIGICTSILLRHLINKYEQHVGDNTMTVVGTVDIEAELFEGCHHDSE